MKTIAIDIDDVLAANAEGFIKFSNRRWGTRLKPDDFTEHWAKLWGIDHKEVERRRDVILKSKVHMTYRFFDEAKPVLKKLAKNYRLVIVSSRSKQISKDTTDWIKENFGEIFSEIHYAKIWDDFDRPVTEKLKMTKAQILREIGADYLIDDQPKHCVAAAKAGIKALLFGDYKWNRNFKLKQNMVRVKNWQEVLEYFTRRNFSL